MITCGRRARRRVRDESRRDVTITGEQRGRSFVVDPLPDPFFPPRLPEDLFSLDAASATGAVVSTVPVEATPTTLSGRVGSADTTIRIRTTSGKVTVRTSD